MSTVYDHPKYFELAFSYRDIRKEVDVLEACIERFSQIPVTSVLELGCGSSPHMEELVGRGYRYFGLDRNESMLISGREKARQLGIAAAVGLINGDMADFSLETKVEFVCIMLGSLYVKNTPELLAHFDAVARVLKPGGLYFLDWCIQYDHPWEAEYADVWVTERDGIRVNTRVSWNIAHRIEQTFEEHVTLEVDDHGKQFTLHENAIKRAIYPQEFLFMLTTRGQFEFVGWWNHWDLDQPLERAEKINRPITLIRRL